MNLYTQLYTDITERITQELSDIKWTDIYLAQELADIRPSVAFPAVLIDFAAAEYENIGKGDQWGNLTIEVHVLQANYASAAAQASSATKEHALRIFELEHQVNSILHDWQPPTANCQPLVRTADRTDNNRSDIGLRHKVITYTTAVVASIN